MSILDSLLCSTETDVFWGEQKTFEDPYIDQGPQAINPFYSILVYGWWWVSSLY